MTTPGPWETPPPRQTVVDLDAYNSAQVILYFQETQHAADGTLTGEWADLLNPPVVVGGYSADNQMQIEHLFDFPRGGLDTWILDQWTIDVTPTLRYPFPDVWSPPLPWPPHAVDWEYDLSGNTTGAYPILSEDLKFTVTLHFEDVQSDYSPDAAVTSDLIVNPVDPTVLTLSGTPPHLPELQNITQTQLNTWPVVGRGNIAVGGSGAITTDEIQAADWINCADIIGGDVAVIRLAINWDNKRTGVDPTASAYRWMRFLSADITSDWQPPRWRFLFDQAPRLRQFPRDDALGGAPRQGRESRSVQGSNRQGWAGAYRRAASFSRAENTRQCRWSGPRVRQHPRASPDHR